MTRVDLARVGDPNPIAAGTSFPGGPSTNELYFRTDLGLLFYYDGTRWLTIELFTAIYHSNPSPLTGSTNGPPMALPGHSFGIYWCDFYFNFYVDGTNDGSKYWTAAMHDQQNSGGADATVKSLNSSASSGSSWTSLHDPINAVSAAPINAYIVWTKTSTPGNVYTTCQATYRLIGT